MKFLADMGISPRSVDHLREQGHDAIHLNEQGLGRLSDAEILVKARREGRIVLTHDLDFGDLMAANQAKLPSVVIFRLLDMKATSVSRYLDVILQAYTSPLQQGAILSVTENRIRIRALPISRTNA